MNAAPETMSFDPALDNTCINTPRFLSVAAVQKADSGHPGMPMGAAPMAYVLWTPLGQGFGNSVGFAIAEAHLAARYNRPGFEIVNHFTYGIVSDGDLMEGVSSEAASLAGHLKLGKLIYLYDDNRVTLSAGTDLTFTEDRARRFDTYGTRGRRGAAEEGEAPAAISILASASMGWAPS